MINHAIDRFARIGSLLLAVCMSGCATGYITSSINTGIGLDVSENAQTQVPHVRFGYIRSGVYYIPTGKVSDPHGSASDTPHVVSKIHVSSEFLKNVDITEKFAVGDQAVHSDGAKQLFADVSSETHGQQVQAPLIVNSGSPFVGVVERSPKVKANRDDFRVDPKTGAAAKRNDLNKRLTDVDDAAALGILQKAATTDEVKGDLTPPVPSTQDGAATYLFNVSQKAGNDLKKLDAWLKLIPKK